MNKTNRESDIAQTPPVPALAVGRPKRTRRWLSYSLRTLLILLTIFCVWLGVLVDKAQRQRRAVEWITNLGGRVTYDYPEHPGAPPSQRPEHVLRPWLVEWIGRDYFDDLWEIGLPEKVMIAGSDWEHFGGLGQVDHVAVPDGEITDSGLAYFTSAKELTFGRSRLTDKGLQHLAKMKRLQVLTVAGSTGLNHQFPNATGPLNLWLDGSRITDAGLVHLKGLQNLRLLSLRNTDVTGTTLDELSAVKELRSLFLDECPIVDAGVQKIASLPQLESLMLSGTQVSDAGLAHLQAMTNLRQLHLEDTAVTDAGLKHLRGMTRLQDLRLTGTSITDAGLAQLEGLTSLEELLCDDTNVTATGLKRLKCLTRLRFLRLSSEGITDADLQSLTNALPKVYICWR